MGQPISLVIPGDLKYAGPERLPARPAVHIGPKALQKFLHPKKLQSGAKKAGEYLPLPD